MTIHIFYPAPVKRKNVASSSTTYRNCTLIIGLIEYHGCNVLYLLNWMLLIDEKWAKIFIEISVEITEIFNQYLLRNNLTSFLLSKLHHFRNIQ